jgi:membrane complex biogenesis BtpA family protein
VREVSGLPVGVNVLRNDVLGAVSVAAMAGGSFVRANVYVGAALTDQGIIEGRAAEVQDLIRRLGAPVAVWADVDVKHAAPIAARPLGDLAEDAVERGLASAVIVTGRATGQPASLEDMRTVKAAVPGAPLYVERDGQLFNPVDPARVRALVAASR